MIETLKEIQLDCGLKFLTRRPLFRELAKINLLIMPDQKRADIAYVSADSEIPDAVKLEQTRAQLQALAEVEELMIKTAVRPRIVPDHDATSDETVAETIALPHALEYYAKLISVHFSQKDFEPFRDGVRSAD